MKNVYEETKKKQAINTAFSNTSIFFINKKCDKNVFKKNTNIKEILFLL